MSTNFIPIKANVLQEIMAFIESAIKEEGEPVEPEVGLNCLAKSGKLSIINVYKF